MEQLPGYSGCNGVSPRQRWIAADIPRVGKFIVGCTACHVAGAILEKLPKDIPVMKLSRDIRGSDGILELMLKGMYLSMHLWMRLRLDIGRPDVADFGKAIYKMDFMMKV